MSQPIKPTDTIARPRWGSEHRDRKALAMWKTLTMIAGPSISEGVWLDAGCGSGGIAATLATHVRHVVAVDPEPWPDWTTLASRHENLEFIVERLDTRESSRLGDASVDVVVCNQVYEHVEDADALIATLHRVLRPNGVCYFAGPNLLWPIEPHVFWPFVHWLPRDRAHAIMRSLGSTRADELDAYSAHYWRLTHLLRTNGFRYVNAIRARASAGLELAGAIRMARLVRAVPQALIDLVTPLAPSFVFVLRSR
jgi:2-polyprenyl-3-methyl-5-hydroxy-6-metoxy-1,4-benzoquinol methylase